MEEKQHRPDVSSTGYRRPRVGRLLGMIGVCTLAWTAGHSTPVWAAAIKDAWVQSIQIIDRNTGRVIPPPVHVINTQKVFARCIFGFQPVSGPPNRTPPFNVAVQVSGRDGTIAKNSNRWDPNIKSNNGITGYGYADMPIHLGTYTGPYPVRYEANCHVDSRAILRGNYVPETANRRRNYKRILFWVDLPSFRRPGPGMARMQHGLALMPNKHIRKCPTSVKAVSKIDPNAFYAPFATASKPTKIPEGRLTLYLNRVETFNDTLLCTYATRAGNARTTVEISCKDAQKTTNGAYCQ